MKKFLALLALLPMFSFGAQMATKEYVDNMKIEAIDGATERIGQVLPDVVEGKVEEYVSTHYFPSVITNTVYLTNIIEEVVIEEYRTIGDKIVNTNGMFLCEIDALNKTYRETYGIITNEPPNTIYYENSNYSSDVRFESTWSTNLTLIARGSDVSGVAIYSLQFRSMDVTNRNDYITGNSHPQTGQPFHIDGYYIPLVYSDNGSTYGIPGFLCIGGYIGFDGSTTNYLSNSTYPAIGSIMYSGDLSSPIELWSDTIKISANSGSWITLQPSTITISGATAYYGKRPPSGRNYSISGQITYGKITSGGGIVTNTITKTNGLVTRDEVNDIVSLAYAKDIITNDIFVAMITNQTDATFIANMERIASAASNEADRAESSADVAASKADAAAASATNSMNYAGDSWTYKEDSLRYSQVSQSYNDSARQAANDSQAASGEATASIATIRELIGRGLVVTNMGPVLDSEYPKFVHIYNAGSGTTYTNRCMYFDFSAVARFGKGGKFGKMVFKDFVSSAPEFSTHIKNVNIVKTGTTDYSVQVEMETGMRVYQDGGNYCTLERCYWTDGYVVAETKYHTVGGSVFTNRWRLYWPDFPAYYGYSTMTRIYGDSHGFSLRAGYHWDFEYGEAFGMIQEFADTDDLDERIASLTNWVYSAFQKIPQL